MIGAFKSYLGLWFYQGALLQDSDKLLVNARDDTTQGIRQLHLTKVDVIDKQIVAAYVQEAIDNQHEGRAVDIASKPAPVIPDLLKEALTGASKNQFEALNLGKKRDYA